MSKAIFVSVILLAAFLAACGRQVTPNPPGLGAGGALPGYMSVKFDVASPFNFTSYQYWVVFNTTGNGLTPDTHPFQNNWAAYSDALEVFGLGAGTVAVPGQFLKNSNPHIPPHFQPFVNLPGQQFQYVANSNGTGTEFTILFQRSIFSPINQTPGPSPMPSPISNIWRFNAFTTQANAQSTMVFVDSMGAGGPVDPQWNSPALDVEQCFDSTYYALSSGLQIDPPAQITSVEIGNNPSPGPTCGSGSPSD